MSPVSPGRACGPTEDIPTKEAVRRCCLGRATEVSVHNSSYNRDLGTYCQNLRSNFYYKLELTVMNLDLIQPIFGSCDT